MNGSGLCRGTVAVAFLSASWGSLAFETDASFEELARESAGRHSAMLSVTTATPPVRWRPGDALLLDGRSTRVRPPSRISALHDDESRVEIPALYEGPSRPDDLRWIPWEAPCLPVAEPSAAAMMLAAAALLPVLRRRTRGRRRGAG